MPSPSTAEAHLRVIRSLMENAAIYRAISARAGRSILRETVAEMPDWLDLRAGLSTAKSA